LDNIDDANSEDGGSDVENDNVTVPPLPSKMLRLKSHNSTNQSDSVMSINDNDVTNSQSIGKSIMRGEHAKVVKVEENEDDDIEYAETPLQYRLFLGSRHRNNSQNIDNNIVNSVIVSNDKAEVSSGIYMRDSSSSKISTKQNSSRLRSTETLLLAPKSKKQITLHVCLNKRILINYSNTYYVLCVIV
jgi:hypothetical protein